MSKWDKAGYISDLVWRCRRVDLPRGENRAVLNRLYGGNPPYTEAEAKEEGIQINRNDLEGVNMLSQARRQWNNAFLPAGNYCSISLDAGPSHKRREWSHSLTRHYNRVLKRSRKYMEHVRAVGANVILHGVGPAMWQSRKSVVPTALAVPSVLIPSETEIDFDNLDYIALFREWTPAQLYRMTHGPKVDPGWNMPLVKSEMQYVARQIQKQINATAFQFMPERIEELIKQDMGYFGTDAVPTVDVWDVYARVDKGWVRRIILDWGVTESRVAAENEAPPKRDGQDLNSDFLYTSGNHIYAPSLEQILHCQFGDCSAVAPFKYHSVRSLGWMLWGVCDLQNRLHCKFSEEVFRQMLIWFRTASNSDLVRIKQAQLNHLGVIPQGISMVLNNERYTPNPQFIEMAFARNRQIMSENAASFTQDFTKGESGKEMTATETMARVNSVNALVSGMLALAYTYEEYKDREILRRLLIPHNPDPLAQEFRKSGLEDIEDPKLLDIDRMEITRERVLGGGNKTLEMAQVQFLQGIRQNLGPDAQRQVDHISIEATTDDAALAEKLAPVDGQKVISNSQHDAQLSTERLMRGLPFTQRPDMVYEDYVLIWLNDLTAMVQRDMANGNMASAADIAGFQNMAAHIGQFLSIMAQDEKLVPKVRQYGDLLKNVMNHVKAFEQRLAQQAPTGGDNGEAAATMAKLQAELAQSQQKLQQMQESHAMRTAQKQTQFELDQQRKDRELNAQIRREDQRASVELAREEAKAAQEQRHETARTAQQLAAENLKALRQAQNDTAGQTQGSTGGNSETTSE